MVQVSDELEAMDVSEGPEPDEGGVSRGKLIAIVGN